MVNDYILVKILDKIKEIIDIEKFDYTKILIETDDKLLEDTLLKNIAGLITCVIKVGGKFFLQIFWKKYFYQKIGGEG